MFGYGLLATFLSDMLFGSFVAKPQICEESAPAMKGKSAAVSVRPSGACHIGSTSLILFDLIT